MNVAAFCLQRPIATMLFWIAVVVAGAASWLQLPISALPRHDTPTIQVSANLPGSSPENIASSVATPLEKQFSAIPGLLASSSTSIQGETKITLEFDPSRDIDAAAADVQAALFRAARSLPPELPTPPSYVKVNPADAPVILVALSSNAMPLSTLNAFSDNLVVPTLASIKGVAQVQVSGQKRYAVRIEVDPQRLAAVDLTLAELANALRAANSNAPIGQLDSPRQMMTLQIDGGLMNAADFARVVIANRQGRALRLSDVAEVLDSIENVQNTSEVNGRASILLNVRRQPDANTVETVDAIRAALPRLQSRLPASVTLQALSDRSTSIRQALHDVNVTLVVTIALVVLVMLAFLRRLGAVAIPAITIPVSLFATFGAMLALGLSLDNLSLMGLTIAVGLVVDDAIVVLESISRHIDDGMAPAQAALRGATEVGFTVMSISVSLVAVFIPIFFMPGTVGRLFHEFAVVLSVSVLVSAAVALTLIPMLVPRLVGPHAPHTPGRVARLFDRGFDAMLAAYLRSLAWALRHRALVLAGGVLTIGLTVWLYQSAAKGFFPQEDIGQLSANFDTAEDMSYEGRLAVLRRIQATVMADPAVATVAAKVDHDTTALVIELKDKTERGPMAGVIRRLRADTAYLPGVQVLFSPVQNLRVGGRSAKSTYQYTLQAVGPADLGSWAERLAAEMGRSSVLVGVASDDQKNGMLARLGVDRDKAALLGVDMASLRNTLNAAYGSRQVSTVYAAEDSYPVIMEIADRQRRTEADILSLQVRGAGATLIPLGAFARVDRANGALSVSHQMQLPAVTLSFDMAPGRSLSEARAAIDAARTQIGMPDTVVGNFAGQAALFEQSQGSQLWLILIAVATIYVVLGMLYESWIHPLTILLGLPSAGLGALLAIRLCGLELSFIAMIGILLLIGIVKKNAIMMIDFAIEARRSGGLGAHDAIVRACELRFRPIMMTTLCSLMGALPLALGWGAGGELRQPLGVSIVGGLLFSQVVTLLVTPVLYLVFDRWAAPHPQALPSAALPST